MTRALVLVALLAATAHAEDRADQLFKKGKKLLAEKRYLEACNTFEKVDKIEPAIGAKLNVAKCYEEWGKLAKAFDWYKDAEKMALDGNDKRADKIKQLADELDADIPRLTIQIQPGADTGGAAIKLDGKPFDGFGKEHRLDPGPHVIEYTVNGEKKTKNLAMERGSSRELPLDLPKATAKPKLEPPPDGGGPPPPQPAVGETDPGRTKRLVAYGLGGAGVVAFGVAGYLTLDARSSYQDALAAHCMGNPDTCTDEGVKLTSDARSRANVATIVTLVGAAAIGAGAYLYFTAPKKASRAEHVRLVPAVSPTSVGVVLGGGF